MDRLISYIYFISTESMVCVSENTNIAVLVMLQDAIFGFFNIEIQMSTISENVFLQFLRNYMFRIQI